MSQDRNWHQPWRPDPAAETTSSGPQKTNAPEQRHASYPARERQEGGEHYRRLLIQPWDAMEAWMSREELRGFMRGNVIKYLARYRDKGGADDLRKARHYLDRLLEIEAAEECEYPLDLLHTPADDNLEEASR